MERLDNSILDDFNYEGGKGMSDWKKDLLKQIVVAVLEYITDEIKNK